MFSRTVGIQKTQIEALEASIDAAISDAASEVLLTSTQPTQSSFAAKPTGLRRYFWWDGQQIRGVFGMIKDFFLPLFSLASSPSLASNIRRVIWSPSQRSVFVHATWSDTATTESRAVDWGQRQDTASWSRIANATVIRVNSAKRILYVDGTTLRFSSIGVSPTTVATVGASTPYLGDIAANETVFFRDSVNPNNVQKRTPAGVISTIVTGFTDLAHMRWDETSQRLILFKFSMPNITEAWKVDINGSGLTQLVPSGVYAAGGQGPYGGGVFTDFIGAEVLNGFLYVPVPGSPYLNTHRKYNILTGAYTTETFDFGGAAAILEPAAIEAKSYMDAAAGDRAMKRAQYFGSQYYAYVFSRLVNFRRSPDNHAWLLTYETGLNSPLPGAQSGLAWAVLPDNGISQKVYPLSDLTYRNPDYFLVAEKVYDTAVKEMTLEWDSIFFQEYPTLVLTFDNGLISATENIRIQFSGDTGANYEYSFYRNAVSTISNTTAAAQNHIELYGVNTTTMLGGFYELTIQGYGPQSVTAASVFGIQIEGFAASGITTGTVNSVLGLAKWSKPAATSLNSVRIFLSGTTASFPAGAAVRLTAYRASAGSILP